MRIETLEKAIKESWNKETCFPGCADEWTPENSAYDQCAVTALIVQDYFGGELLFCEHNFHFWNKFPNGEEVDLTRNQFPAGTVICLDKVESRDYVLNSNDALCTTTPQRYQLLRESIEEKLETKEE